MANFDATRALADVSSYSPDRARRGEKEIKDELRRLEGEVRRLAGLLAASQARDEVATDLLRAEVRRTVTAEAERDRWQSEAERLATLTPPPPSGPGLCDVCGAPSVRITTPGAIRFCAEHALTSDDSVRVEQ